MATVLEEAQELLIKQYLHDRKIPLHGSNLFSGLYPCYRIYRAACGRRVAVGAIEEKFWSRVCDILEIPDCLPHRMAEGELGQQVTERVQQAWSRRTWNEWSGLFEKADCCVEPIRDYSELPYGL
jgi:crotonobetainyl-CoA:carnitine CoA-transferase CaiB-like acyl-CoA transferase